VKEIDFLPEWYKSGRRRKNNYRVQYVILGVLFFVLLGIDVCMMNKANKLQNDFLQLQSKAQQSVTVSQEYSRLENVLKSVKAKANLLNRINSHIRTSQVLAELSYLVDEGILLGNVVFDSEDIGDQASKRNKAAGRIIRLSGSNNTSDENEHLRPVRFKVIINGLASESSKVADLVCKLEESPYFFQVIPSYSRNIELKVGDRNSSQKYKVSEFEISCYLANYNRQGDQKKNKGRV